MNTFQGSQSGGAKAGIIVTVAFLTIAGFAYWLGTAPPILPMYDRPSNYPQDPGFLAVENIFSDGIIPQKFTMTGSADSAWFYEGTSPAKVLSGNGMILWEGEVIVSGDYIVGEVLVYTVDIDVGNYTGPAEIIIMRDNASEDPMYDKEYRIPVTITDEVLPNPGELN